MTHTIRCEASKTEVTKCKCSCLGNQHGVRGENTNGEICRGCDKNNVTHKKGGYFFPDGSNGILNMDLCDNCFQEFLDAK